MISPRLYALMASETQGGLAQASPWGRGHLRIDNSCMRTRPAVPRILLPRATVTKTTVMCHVHRHSRIAHARGRCYNRAWRGWLFGAKTISHASQSSPEPLSHWPIDRCNQSTNGGAAVGSGGWFAKKTALLLTGERRQN